MAKKALKVPKKTLSGRKKHGTVSFDFETQPTVSILGSALIDGSMASSVWPPEPDYSKKTRLELIRMIEWRNGRIKDLEKGFDKMREEHKEAIEKLNNHHQLVRTSELAGEHARLNDRLLDILKTLAAAQSLEAKID